MRNLTYVGAALAALCAVAATMASSALALPDVSVVLGGAYPLERLTSSTTVKTEAHTFDGQLKATGLSLQLITTALSPEGTFALLFKNAEAGEQKCRTEGDAEGELLLKGTFHAVYINLAPLTLGLLFTIEELALGCGAAKFKLRGAFLASLTAAEGELTETSSEIKGNGKGVSAIKDYFNDEGKEVVARVELNFGAGWVDTALELSEAIKMTAQGGKMFEVTGR